MARKDSGNGNTLMYDFSFLRELRKHEGLTIGDVSARSGISAAVISKLERNRSGVELGTLSPHSHQCEKRKSARRNERQHIDAIPNTTALHQQGGPLTAQVSAGADGDPFLFGGAGYGDRIRVVRDFQEVPTVCCKANALNQVFLNLLMNAIQSIDREGEIRVATGVAGDDVIIGISDTGSGISRDDACRIFELGFTTRSGRGGSGIGLALCQRIVEEHGGSISVDSEPGRGSTFTVRLPLRSRGGSRS